LKLDSGYSAVCHSAITVVNALTTGFGAAIGIDLRCEITASFSQSAVSKNPGKIELKSEFEDKYGLIQTSVNRTLRLLHHTKSRDGIVVSIKSDIPPAVGLKSSSALSVATVKAIAGLVGRKLDDREILKQSCLASKHSGASITGAYDDASACLLGGFVLTYNPKFELIERRRVPTELGNIVVIRVPIGTVKFTGSIDARKTYSPFKAESAKAFEYAQQNEIYLAMMLNSIVQSTALGYPFELLGNAVNEGASCVGVSGKGPAMVAICRSNKIADRIESLWSPGKRIGIIRTKIVQPSK